MPSVLIGPVLMAVAGLVLLLAFFGWMMCTTGILAYHPKPVMPRRSAIMPPPAVTVLDGVVIPKRKAIEP